MQIDVIIPTYNRSRYLKRAVDSVLAQTYGQFILHIIDDGSTDDTQTYLKQLTLHSKIKTYYQNNKGVSAARNLAVLNSYSPWISFLDSDDEWLPEKLESQIQYLQSNPECHFIHSEEQWIRNNVRVNPKIKHAKNSDRLFERSLDFCLISPSTVMMKRELFIKHGGFNEQFIVCEDYDLWLKVLISEKIGYLPTALIKKYGGHEDQLSSQFKAMDYWRIKSLINLITNTDYKDLLKKDQEELIKETILKKSEILLKGFLKHNRIQDYEEIKALLQTCQLSSNV